MGCTPSSTAVEEESSDRNTPVRRIGNTFAGVPDDSFLVEDAVSKPVEIAPHAYQQLDEEICALESTCPGPRLLTAEAWLEHLETVFEKSDATSDLYERDLIMDVRLNEVPNGIVGMPMTEMEAAESISNRSRDDTAKLALKLDIAVDPVKAARQEEFIARISRSAMGLEAKSYQADTVEHCRTRIRQLRQSFIRLQALYLELDRLIAMANNGTYFSSQEQHLDEELESAREIRDRLGGVSEQWRTAGLLMRAAQKGLLQAVKYWNLVGQTSTAPEKIALALDCRSVCHGALIALEIAQAALPQVEIPFVTLRQQSAVKHGLIYMLTDMINPSRYRHTKNVLEGFQANVEKSVKWLHDTFNETLKKDFDESDQAVISIAKKLREIRKQYITQRMGYKPYVRPAMGKTDKR
ncbi:AAEL001821-PA [Aedes aegypti]|uniref:AAEL001821-PA n=1 Tax=Aedes aegypti TaxID=7159 RepID=Q17K37_AEDAE|nr:AAEL001821-PA [Aedes aegypti]